jgi:hypothetical protein
MNSNKEENTNVEISINFKRVIILAYVKVLKLGVGKAANVVI